MNRYILRLNSKRCIGCHGCVVHCKVNKGLPAGPMLCHVSHPPLRTSQGVPRTEFQFHTCLHCEDPLCLPACPVRAMQKRNDGIVFIDQEKCTGCLNCAAACPWHIPQLNGQSGTAVKCDYCRERLDAGLLPACVSRCTTGALRLLRLEEI